MICTRLDAGRWPARARAHRNAGAAGKQHRRELARLRLVSGPKFRAYIAAHSVAWGWASPVGVTPATGASTCGAPIPATTRS